MDVSAWKQLYAQAVAATDADRDTKTTSASATASSSSSKDSVVQFLESVLAPTGPTAKSSPTQQPSLADIGKELLVPVAELSTIKLTKEQELDHDAVMRVLQLQVISRLLVCCEKMTKKKAKQKGKQRGPSSSQLKLVKKELRSLLDRIALLLDAANPPSLTDEDERSPFHEFLQDVLAKAFTKRLPKLVKFLLATYELEDETRAMDNLTLNTLPQAISLVKAIDTATTAALATIPPAAAAPSILSALLRDEQRPIKRSRTETVVPFKKMEIPNELRRRSSLPSTRKDLLKAVKSTGTTSASVSTSTSSPAIPRSSSKEASLSRSSSKSRATKSAEKPSLTPQSSLGHRSTSGSKGAPLLMRNIDRALFAGPQSRFTPSASNNTPHTIVTSGGPTRSLSASKHPLLATTPKNFKPVMPGAAPTVAVPGAPAPVTTTRAPRTTVSTLIKNERTSVVMRTPDRPQRRPHRTARVLIESSPPFRNPNVGAGAVARQRKQPTAIPPPLLR